MTNRERYKKAAEIIVPSDHSDFIEHLEEFLIMIRIRLDKNIYKIIKK